jgi:hypothetical protein
MSAALLSNVLLRANDIAATTPRPKGLSLGLIVRPSDRSAAYISDALRGSERRVRGGLCDGSLQVGGVRAVEQERRPTPSVYLRPG